MIIIISPRYANQNGILVMVINLYKVFLVYMYAFYRLNLYLLNCNHMHTVKY